MHVIIENVVALNSGDAAILIAIMKIIRDAIGSETKFSVFDSSPEIAQRYYPDIDFYPLTSSLTKGAASIRIAGVDIKIPFGRKAARLRERAFWRKVEEASAGKELRSSLLLDKRVLRNLKIYQSADLVISTGGTYLVEHYDFKDRLVEFRKDIALGKPLVFFTQSLGPFAKRPNREALKEIGDKARLILLRDERSQQNLRNIGITHDRLKVVADSVFALADVDRLVSLKRPTTTRPPKVAISVREWRRFSGLSPAEGMKRYEEAIADSVTVLVRERRAEIEFISTCQGVAEYAFDDSIVASRIVERLDDDVKQFVRVDRLFHTPTDLLEKIKDFDFIISTRMHMAILALCVGVPVLPIAYEFKTRELYKSLKQEQWVTDISSIERDSFGELVRRFVDGRHEFVEQVSPYIIAQWRSANSAGEMIASLV